MDTVSLYYQFSMAMIIRELKSTFHQKLRLMSALVRPLLWLWILGFGLTSMTHIPGVNNYQIFLVPGLLGLTLLFGCVLAAMSFVMDQQAGLHRLISTAPVCRSWVIITSVVSMSLVGLVQISILLLVVAPLGYVEPSIHILKSVGALILVALNCSSIGLLMATSMRHFQAFAGIMNFLIFPMFFLSGALYPTHHMPTLLQYLIYANPFAHGVNLLHHYFNLPTVTIAPPEWSILYIVGISLVCVSISVMQYKRRFIG